MAVALALTLGCPARAAAGWLDDALEGVRQIESGQSERHAHVAGLSQRQVAEALKQALRKGARLAIHELGRENGFWRNAEFRIPLPDAMRTPARLLRQAGLGSYVDRLHMRLNRAAEAAVPKARPIFYQAIRDMSIRDARRLLHGGEDAITRYFRRKTMPALRRAFTPVVHRELERSGAIRGYRAFVRQYASLPLVGERLNADIDGYVTKRALDAMFTMLAREERRIRRHPAERTTELLRKVFR